MADRKLVRMAGQDVWHIYAGGVVGFNGSTHPVTLCDAHLQAPSTDLPVGWAFDFENKNRPVCEECLRLDADTVRSLIQRLADELDERVYNHDNGETYCSSCGASDNTSRCVPHKPNCYLKKLLEEAQAYLDPKG